MRTKARRSLLFAPVAALAVALSAAGFAPAASAAAGEVCPGVPVPAFRDAVPNATYDGLIGAYATDRTVGSHWTGGDGTYSTALPDGRVAFIFSDTFLGHINPDGTRSPRIQDGGTTPFINNSFVVKSRDRLSTVTDGTQQAPAAPMPPPDATHWYWAGDAISTKTSVQVTYQEYEKTGPSDWDFRWSRNVVARYSPHNLGRPTSVRSLPSGAGVAWASWLEPAGGHTYIYGVEDQGGTKYMHLARVKGRQLGNPWEFYKGDGTWSDKETESAPVLPGVANEYSVSKLGNVYMLLTQDTTEPFSAHIVAYYSCRPEGPFVAKTPIYTTPETGAFGRYGNPNVFTYNAHTHPEISSAREVVASYNVNSFAITDLYKDASIYRPRFITLRFD